MVSNLTAFLRWYLVLALIAWISLPVACKLFSRLPDRGLAFSKPFGLLFSAYLFHLRRRTSKRTKANLSEMQTVTARKIIKRIKRLAPNMEA